MAEMVDYLQSYELKTHIGRWLKMECVVATQSVQMLAMHTTGSKYQAISEKQNTDCNR
jgi:hypothetical protein